MNDLLRVPLTTNNIRFLIDNLRNGKERTEDRMNDAKVELKSTERIQLKEQRDSAAHLIEHLREVLEFAAFYGEKL